MRRGNAPVGLASLLILLLASPAAGEPAVGPTHAHPVACTARNFCPAQPLVCAPGDVPADPGGENVCEALAEAAGANDLPVDFFTRLIWQESRFDSKAVSLAGAQGIAQFMPGTAILRGLADPFDPAEAIVKSAQLLRDLRHEFGNLGLAAAAYNAGPGRVRDWLAGRRGLPGETRAYVRIVTGRSAEEWIGTPPPDATEMPLPRQLPCGQIAGLVLDPGAAGAPPRVRKPIQPWGVELVGSASEPGALAAWRQLQQKYSAILAGYEPRVVFHGVVRDMGWARVRIDAETRENANKLCASLRAAGAGCDVLRN